jgi:transposase
MERLVVGIDVSQHTIDVAYWEKGNAIYLGNFSNNPDGFNDFRETIYSIGADDKQVLVVMEPTGGYEQLLVSFCTKEGWLVSLPNPLRVREWARGTGQRAKTDKQDACMLCRYGAIQQPPTWHPLLEEVSVLDDLLSRLEDLESLLNQEKNRYHAFKNKTIQSRASKESLSQSIAFLEAQIESIKQSIERHFEEYPKLKQQNKQLQSVPGIGKKNAPFILVLLYRFSTLTSGKGTAKGITAYVGLDPTPYQSGTSVYKRSGISRQGNKRARHYLFMGALGGVRGNNPLKEFYQRLVGRGKAKMVALIAAARKILVWSWAIYKNNTIFDSQRFCAN